MCVLFYSSFLCLRVCAYAFDSGSALGPGASGLTGRLLTQMQVIGHCTAKIHGRRGLRLLSVQTVVCACFLISSNNPIIYPFSQPEPIRIFLI